MRVAVTTSGADGWVRDIEAAFTRAARGMIEDAEKTILTKGKKNIASAGFGARWQNSLKTRTTFEDDSMSLLVFDTIPYFGVFEEGGAISGHPVLWIPLPTVPLGVGGRPLTPKAASARFGKLVSINRQGHRPLLAAKIEGRHARAVPLYVGVSRVTEPKRFAIKAIIDDVIASLPELFERNLKA